MSLLLHLDVGANVEASGSRAHADGFNHCEACGMSMMTKGQGSTKID
jgi:hypothetical protein